MPDSGAEKAAETGAAEARFSEGEQLLARGERQGALSLFSTVLREHPTYVPAYLIVARMALESGNPDVCIATLEKGLDNAGEHVDLRFKLGLVYQRAGRMEAAHEQFSRVVELDPGQAGAWLKLGVCADALGNPEQGAMAIQRAFWLKPEIREAVADTTLPEAMRSELKKAQSLLRRRYAAMADSSIAAARSRFPDANLKRLEEAFAFLQGKPRRWCHPGQRPGFLLFPDMPARPWYERGEFAWVPEVEAATPVIMEELAGLSSGAEGFAPYLHGVSRTRSTTTYTGEDFSVLADSMDWNAFHLMKAGAIEENIKRCPRTMQVLEALPLASARDYMPEVFFSVLRPGAHIVPHYGQMNIRLTVHLGMVIPKGCGIRVHDETRNWRSGEILVFDDSFKHEAWNRAQTERVVLIFEVWHPDLSDGEIYGIQQFMEQRGEWMAQLNTAPEAASLAGDSGPGAG